MSHPVSPVPVTDPRKLFLLHLFELAVAVDLDPTCGVTWERVPEEGWVLWDAFDGSAWFLHEGSSAVKECADAFVLGMETEDAAQALQYASAAVLDWAWSGGNREARRTVTLTSR